MKLKRKSRKNQLCIDELFEKIARLITKYNCQEYNIVTSTDAFRQATVITANMIKERFGSPILPYPGESVAIDINNYKTAALFYDRVWAPIGMGDRPPEGIIMYGATEFEIWLQSLLLLINPDKWNWEKIHRLVKDTVVDKFWKSNIVGVRKLSEHFFKNYNIITTPIYESIESLKIEYQPGNIEVIFAAIKNIGIVDEGKLEWSQVMEFRKDINVRRKYRRMIHWLDTEIVGKPVDFISDRIANKLEDYEWALKKHGIETITGCLSRIIDPRFLAGTSAAVAGLAYAGDQFMAAIGGLGLLAGNAAISITKTGLNIIDRKRGKDSEIAYVYDMKKKLK